MSSITVSIDDGVAPAQDSSVVATLRSIRSSIGDFAVVRRVIVPVGAGKAERQSRTVELPAGVYVVEADFPGGGRVDDTVEILEGDDVHLRLAAGSAGARTVDARGDTPTVPPSSVFAARQELSFDLSDKRRTLTSEPTCQLLMPRLLSERRASIPFDLVRGDMTNLADLFTYEYSPNAGRLRARVGGNSTSATFEFEAEQPDELDWIAVHYAEDNGLPSLELVSVPSGWTDSLTREMTGAKLTVALSRPVEQKFASFLSVRDTGVGSAISYFNRRKLEDAGTLVDAARDMLFRKVRNPVAAAAGAYILFALDRSKRHRSRHDWHDWILNLDAWFPGLPDGSILKAWLHLENRDFRTAKGEFKNAYSRGIPAFSEGLRLLAQGIGLFAGEDAELSEMDDEVRIVCRHADFSQPFTVLRFG